MRKIIRGFGNLVKTRFGRVKLHDQIDPTQFIGKVCQVRRELDAPEESVIVQDIKGCVAEHLEKYFQINGKYLCHMLSFYTQMLEDRVPTKEEMDEFELASQIKRIKEIGNGKKEG